MMTYFVFVLSAFSVITSSLIFLCSSLEIRPISRSSLRISSCCCTHVRCVYIQTECDVIFQRRRQTHAHGLMFSTTNVQLFFFLFHPPFSLCVCVCVPCSSVRAFPESYACVHRHTQVRACGDTQRLSSSVKRVRVGDEP